MLAPYYRAILDGSPDGVLVELRDRIIYLNDAYAHLLGYRNALELRDATVRDIAHPEEQERLSFYSRCRERRRPAPERYAFCVCKRDRSVLQVDATVGATRIGAEVLIVTSVRAVSAQESSTDTNGLEPLTAREAEVFRLIIAGYRNKLISLQLGISEKTVSAHRIHINRKLALHSDLDLFRFAAAHGLLNDRS